MARASGSARATSTDSGSSGQSGVSATYPASSNSAAQWSQLEGNSHSPWMKTTGVAVVAFARSICSRSRIGDRRSRCRPGHWFHLSPSVLDVVDALCHGGLHARADWRSQSSSRISPESRAVRRARASARVDGDPVVGAAGSVTTSRGSFMAASTRRIGSSNRNCSGPPISTTPFTRRADGDPGRRPRRRPRPPSAGTATGGRRTVSPTVAASAMPLMNSKNWVAWTIEYGIAGRRDQVLLGRASPGSSRRWSSPDRRSDNAFVPTTESATWWPTPAAASAASRLCVDVSKNSSAVAYSKLGELETSTTTDAPSSAAASPSPVIVLTPEPGRGRDGLVAVLGELRDELRADEPGAADDDDLQVGPVLSCASDLAARDVADAQPKILAFRSIDLRPATCKGVGRCQLRRPR